MPRPGNPIVPAPELGGLSVRPAAPRVAGLTALGKRGLLVLPRVQLAGLAQVVVPVTMLAGLLPPPLQEP